MSSLSYLTHSTSQQPQFILLPLLYTSLVWIHHSLHCSEDSVVSVSNNLFPFSGSAHIFNGVFEEIHPDEIHSVMESGFLDARTHHTNDGLYFHFTTSWNEVGYCQSFKIRLLLISIISTHLRK